MNTSDQNQNPNDLPPAPGTPPSEPADGPLRGTLSARNPRKRKGVALVLVISFIVLLSALVVMFFTRVSTELASASSYSEGISARHLADTAVSIVQGQIRSATTIPNGCWTSQPGMLRVFAADSGGTTIASTQAYKFFKLYSSHDMVVSRAEMVDFDPSSTTAANGAKTEVPLGAGGWIDMPAHFTDLNEPIVIPDPANPSLTTRRYPIMDPGVARIAALGQNMANNSPGYVEGAEITLAAGVDLTRNNAPMPVRWIYILKDGSLTASPLTAAASGTGTSATGYKVTWGATGPDGVSTTGVPTADNPIVGRIAFWADDETSKININTAAGYLLPSGVNEDTASYNQAYTLLNQSSSETNAGFIAGSFWDTPRIQTYFDRGKNGGTVMKAQPPSGTTGWTVNFLGGLSTSQPCAHEYQRYPGHVAQTSLALVYKNLLNIANFSSSPSEQLYMMSPRTREGGSMNGTNQADVYANGPLKNKFTFYSLSSTPTSYHLYGSVDELVFATQNLTVNSSTLNRTLADVAIGMPSNTITPTLADKTRFFVTAHNRAPELNLFGQPRVAIWPVPSWQWNQNLFNLKPAIPAGVIGVDGQPILMNNASDDLIRFCATVGADVNKTYNYPGTTYTDPNPAGLPTPSGNPVSDPTHLNRPGQFIFDREDPYSPSFDFQARRNQVVMKYLASSTASATQPLGLTYRKFPGFGTRLSDKYAGGPAGIEGIITEIFDFIRCANLKDTSRDKSLYKMPYGGDWLDRDNTNYPGKGGGSWDGTGNVFQNKPIYVDPATGDVPKSPNDSNTTPATARKQNQSRFANRGIVVPTRSTFNGHPVAGFGRFPTVTACDLVFYHGGYLFKPNPIPLVCNTTAGSNIVTVTANPPTTTTNNPSGGIFPTALTGTNSNGLTVNGTVTLFPSGVPTLTPVIPTNAKIGTWPTATTFTLVDKTTPTNPANALVTASSVVLSVLPETNVTGAPFIEDVAYDMNFVDLKNQNNTGIWWRARHAMTGQLVRAFLVFEMYNPMQGYAPMSSLDIKQYTGNPPGSFQRIAYEIINMSEGFEDDATWAIQSIPFDPLKDLLPPLPIPGFVVQSTGATSQVALKSTGGKLNWLPLGGTRASPKQNLKQSMSGATKLNVWLHAGALWNGRAFGGIEGFFHLLQGKPHISKDVTNITTDPQSQRYYPFQSPSANKDDGVKVPWHVVTLSDYSTTSGSPFVKYSQSWNTAGDPSISTPRVGMAVYGFNMPVGTTTPVYIIQVTPPTGTTPGTIKLNTNVTVTSVSGTATSTVGLYLTCYIADTTFRFSGGTMDLTITYLDATHTNPATQLVQTLHFSFPKTTDAPVASNPSPAWPLPITERETAARVSSANATLQLGQTYPWPALERGCWASTTSTVPYYRDTDGSSSGWWQDQGGFDARVLSQGGSFTGTTGGTGYNLLATQAINGGVNHSFTNWLTAVGGPSGVNNSTTSWAWGYGSTNPTTVTYLQPGAWVAAQGEYRYSAPSSAANRVTYKTTAFGTTGPIWPDPTYFQSLTGVGTYQSPSGWAIPYQMGTRSSWSSQHSMSPWGSIDTYWAGTPPYSSLVPPGRRTGGDDKHYTNRWRQILQPGDTIRSLVVGGVGVSLGSSDPRVVAILQDVPTGLIGPHPLYHAKFAKSNLALRRRAENMRNPDGSFFFPPTDSILEPGATAQDPSTGSLVPLGGAGSTAVPVVHHNGGTGPYVPRNMDFSTTPANFKNNTVLYQTGGSPNYADFDNGIGSLPDGGFNNKPDEGNLARYWVSYPTTSANDPNPPGPTIHWVEPYFNTWAYDPPLDTYFSPNRQMPSAMMFGSMLAPQGAWTEAGWKTLLFCPNPANQNHPGFGSASVAPDHLLMDLFWMPVVEPYAISEPLSTEGKININYAIMPFGYIKRTTGLRALLQGQRVTAIPHNWTNGNRELSYKGQDNSENVRYMIDRDETLKAFDALFAKYTPGTPDLGIFKSATEICERFLYPKGQVFAPAAPSNTSPSSSTLGNGASVNLPINMTTQAVTYNASESNIKTWWGLNLLTGDNLREKPYGDIYPRITTKSNTFTVHYRVQTLRQRPFPGSSSDTVGRDNWYKVWDEARDQVLSELRGSTTIERFIDPLDARFTATLPGGGQNPTFINVQKDSLEPAYRFRIISNKRFQPW